jgi:uncharacterized membrane protein
MASSPSSSPQGSGLAALKAGVPIFLAYARSYLNVGIFWNHHHHMLHATERINGRVLWCNLILLFWLSLVPLVIRWMDEAGFTPLPTAAYGAALAVAAIGYTLLQRANIAANGRTSHLATALGHDLKGELSLATYVAAVPVAFLNAWVAVALYIAVALMWFVRPAHRNCRRRLTARTIAGSVDVPQDFRPTCVDCRHPNVTHRRPIGIAALSWFAGDAIPRHYHRTDLFVGHATTDFHLDQHW